MKELFVSKLVYYGGFVDEQNWRKEWSTGKALGQTSIHTNRWYLTHQRLPREVLPKLMYCFTIASQHNKTSLQLHNSFICGLLPSPFSYRFWLNLGSVLIGVNIVIGAYFVIWVSYYLKISNWDSHNTVLIPIATASFIAGMIWWEFW